ncbi:MAG: hypothetical protein HOC84_05125 [Flavobacteriaceae bacterium]|nr:hypothetical protein [Flavobacteriaceae bacterium]
MKNKFYTSQLDSIKDVLFESENKRGYIYGFSNNYVRVKAPWRKELVNSIVSYELKEIDQDGLVVGKKLEKLITV